MAMLEVEGQVKGGVLKKKGKTLGGMHKRYFILTREGKFMSCKTHGDTIKSMKPVAELSADSAITQDDVDPHAFHIIIGQRVLTLAAESDDERKEWISTLKQVKAYLADEEADLDFSGLAALSSPGRGSVASDTESMPGGAGAGAAGSAGDDGSDTELTATQLRTKYALRQRRGSTLISTGGESDGMGSDDDAAGGGEAGARAEHRHSSEAADKLRIRHFETPCTEMPGDAQGARESIPDAMRARLLHALAECEVDEGVLVADPPSLRVLSRCVSLADLARAGIDVVEPLSEKRRRTGAVDGVYMIDPHYRATAAESGRAEGGAGWASSMMNFLGRQTEEGGSLSWVTEHDFRKKSPFRSVHLYFLSPTGEADDRILPALRAAPALLNAMKRPPMFLSAGFLPEESQVFSLDAPLATVSLFSPERGDQRETLAMLAKRLVTFCVAMHEYPYVRFRATDPTACNIALTFQQELDAQLRDNTRYWYTGMADVTRRSTLLFLSRAEDLPAALVHEFTYQSMAADLLTLPHDSFASCPPEALARRSETATSLLAAARQHGHAVAATAAPASTGHEGSHSAASLFGRMSLRRPSRTRAHGDSGNKTQGTGGGGAGGGETAAEDPMLSLTCTAMCLPHLTPPPAHAPTGGDGASAASAVFKPGLAHALREPDPLWRRFRHMHISKVEEELRLLSSGLSPTHSAGHADVLARCAIHRHVVRCLMQRLQQHGLIDLAPIEQALATGVDELATQPSAAESLDAVMDAAQKLLKRAGRGEEGDAVLDGRFRPELLRVALLLLLRHRRLPKDAHADITKRLRLNGAQARVVNNLEYMDGSISAVEPNEEEERLRLRREVERVKQSSANREESLSRFQPRLADIVRSALDGSLSRDKFAYVMEPPEGMDGLVSSEAERAIRATPPIKPRNASAQSKAEAVLAEAGRQPRYAGPRLIVFVAGGVSHAELKWAYKLSEEFGRQVLIGSNVISAPSFVLESMSELRSE